jgi:hypothetical protein
VRRRDTQCDFFTKSIDAFACDETFFGGGDAIGCIDGGGEAEGYELLFSELSLDLGSSQRDRLHEDRR